MLPAEDAATAEILFKELLLGKGSNAPNNDFMGSIKSGRDALIPATKAKAKQVGIEAVVALCRKASGGYGITLEAAKTELESLRKNGQGGSRRGLVLQVLINEQKVLARTSFLLKQQLRDLKEQR